MLRCYGMYECYDDKEPSIKDVRREGGGGVAQKRTNADKGEGGSRQSGRPQQQKNYFQLFNCCIIKWSIKQKLIN